MGRFISEDTYKGKPDDPMSLNLYAYCKGNPIRYVDPTGHDTYTATGIVDPYYGNVPGLQEFAQVTSIAIGFTPVDVVKDAADFVAGKDIVTGEKMSRLVLVGCIIGPEVTDQVLKSTTYAYKHFAPKNVSWKKVIESTKSGPAKYIFGTDIAALEQKALKNGIDANGKPWKVYDAGKPIGAKDGIETRYIRVEISLDGTVHSHPITPQEYQKYIK